MSGDRGLEPGTAPAPAPPALAERNRLLAELGAGGPVREELAAYLENPYLELLRTRQELPLMGEPQSPYWRRYAAEGVAQGVLPTLRRRFPQLSFPIKEGLSQDPTYRNATRRGEWDPEEQKDLVLEQPESLELFVDEGVAGPVPVLVARHRPDFVALVRALTCRNEPEPVPPAMGACLVKGLADWERVREYRRAWEAGRGGAASAAEWATEMASGLVPRKELWQDRLILLSDGPYSAVPAAECGLDEIAWRRASLAIRLAHESFHYLTLRLAGLMRSHFLDELVADFAGLLDGFGGYDARLALRCLGLDRLPEIRPDGRFAVYRGELSEGGVTVLARLLERAAASLAELALRRDLFAEAGERARSLVALAALGLDGIAGPSFAPRFEAARSQLSASA